MARMNGKIVAATLALTATLAVASHAEAVDYYLGYDALQNRVEWCVDTGVPPPVTVVIAAGNALPANQVFNLTPNNDRAKVVRGAMGTACGNYTPINFAGFTVTINGLGGNDIMSGGSGPTFLNGGDGEDHVIMFWTGGGADGGNNNDCVASHVAGGGEVLRGQLGNDCLDQVGPGAATAATFDCGGGFDQYRLAPMTAQIGCEAVFPPGCGCTVF